MHFTLKCFFFFFFYCNSFMSFTKSFLTVLNWHHLIMKFSTLLYTQYIHTLLFCCSKLCRQKRRKHFLSSHTVTTLAFPEKEILRDITCELSSWINILLWSRKRWEFQRHDIRRQITMATYRKLYFSLGLKLQTQNTAKTCTHCDKQAARGILKILSI